MTSTTDTPRVRAGTRKHEAVARLSEQLSRATSAVITDYRGLTVKQLEELRHRLRTENVDYVIVKNTLARRAAHEAGADNLAECFRGPVGLALGYADLSTPARILNDYWRVNRRLPMVAGVVEGTVLDGAGMRTIAELPSRDVLLGQLAGTLQSPLAQLAGALDSILSTFAATLDAYRERLESQPA